MQNVQALIKAKVLNINKKIKITLLKFTNQLLSHLTVTVLMVIKNQFDTGTNISLFDASCDTFKIHLVLFLLVHT